MKRKPTHGPLPEGPWDVAMFRRAAARYFPRWRTEGMALCEQYGADLIERACIFILNEQSRETVREWVRYGVGAGAARRQRLLQRSAGRRAKPVVTLLRDGGVRPLQTARAVARTLEAVLGGERDQELLQRARRRADWQRLTDLMLRARQDLNLKGKHASENVVEQLRAWVEHEEAKRWATLKPGDGGLPQMPTSDWPELVRLGLHLRSTSQLKRGHHKPEL